MIDEERAKILVMEMRKIIEMLSKSLYSIEDLRGSDVYDKMKRTVGESIGRIDVDFLGEIYKFYPHLDDIDY